MCAITCRKSYTILYFFGKNVKSKIYLIEKGRKNGSKTVQLVKKLQETPPPPKDAGFEAPNKDAGRVWEKFPIGNLWEILM